VSRLVGWLSKISIRLLAFNILLVFLPAGGMLLLDTYEQHLLDAQERTMVQEGRLLAAALETRGRLRSDDARNILVQLGQRHEARLRVLDSTGDLLADSAVLGPQRPSQVEPLPEPEPGARQTLLYRLGSLPFRATHQILDLLEPEVGQAPDRYDTVPLRSGPEIQAALAGRYGSSTRIAPGSPPTVTLYCAIPIRIHGSAHGAVLVSQSTSRILRALYAVRLDIFEVFLASLGAAVVLTLLMATTIARPLARLRRQAEVVVDRKGRIRTGFVPGKRRDEIGELERALAELTRRLEEHLQSMEAFTADVAHEFKNPLASIRTATEMALEVDEPDERRRFLEMIQGEVARMERLLTGAREISHIDARLDQEERLGVRLDELLEAIVEAFRLRLGGRGPTIHLAVASHDSVVEASPDRLTQVFENIIDNAVGFSPPGGRLTITIRSGPDAATVLVIVADEGPGIPEQDRQRIFDRFFSYRSGPAAGDQDHHSGLGLAIVKAIVEGYGGSVVAQPPSRGQGTRMVVTLPRVR